MRESRRLPPAARCGLGEASRWVATPGRGSKKWTVAVETSDPAAEMLRPSVRTPELDRGANMMETALIVICTCAIVAALLAILRRFGRAGIVPHVSRGPVVGPVRSPKTERVPPTAGVPFLPRPGLPARLRGGRRELLYLPPVCSRVRRDGSSPLHGAISPEGSQSKGSLIAKRTKQRPPIAFRCSRANPT
jgi:hypothetical protein